MSHTHPTSTLGVSLGHRNSDSQPSTVLDLTSQIECNEVIGRGGFGYVYKGRWRREAMNAVLPPVVVKVIKLPAPINEKQENKQFKRELELWSKLNDKNVLPLLGIAHIDDDANIPAFIYPWIENGNARQFRLFNPSFPPLIILYDIIQGLDYLHTFDPEIVHGDIKAANVLINNRNEACLCDFGLSRFLNDSTRWITTAKQAGGSIRWMSPELITGKECMPTKESDIYSYGMTCYEILSGDVPFKSVTNEHTLLYKLTQGERPERIKSCHPDLWQIITLCWAEKPEDRLWTIEVLNLVGEVKSSLQPRPLSEASISSMPLDERFSNIIADINQQNEMHKEELQRLQTTVLSMFEDMKQEKEKHKAEIERLKAKIYSMEAQTFSMEHVTKQQGTDRSDIEHLEAKVFSMEHLENQKRFDHKEEIERLKAKISSMEHRANQQKMEIKERTAYQRGAEHMMEIDRLEVNVLSTEGKHKKEIEGERPIPVGSPQLLDLPGCVLLHLVQFLEVEDAMSFSMVSSKLHNLFRHYERTFWIETLTKTRQLRPIPCPPQADLTQYDTETLRGVALHFIRLNRNWRNSKPVVRRVRTLDIDQVLEPLAQIPGTHYVITHSPQKATLSLWSTEDGSCICTIEGHRRVLDLSTEWTEPGKFTMALLTTSVDFFHPTDIQIITVDYSGPSATLHITYSKQLELADSRYYRAIFLNAEVVGVLYINDMDDHETPSPFHVLALNRITDRESDICISMGITENEYHMIWESDEIGTSFWNDSLYLHRESDIATTQGWIPRALLPYNDNINAASRVIYTLEPLIPKVHQHPRNTFSSVEGILTMKADFGVVAATIYTFHPSCIGIEQNQSTGVKFWVIDSPSITQAAEHGSLPVPASYPPIVIPGTIMSECCSYQTTSAGIFLILVLEDEDKSFQISVVHLQLPNHQFTCHTIDLPPEVELNLIYDFSIDEYRGAVTLHDIEGKMIVLEYA